MKKVLYKIMVLLAYILSYLINIKVVLGIKAFYRNLITFAYAREFKSCGSEFYLEGPCKIIGMGCITLGNDVHIYSNVRLEAIQKYKEQIFNPVIIIGNNVHINDYCHIGCIGTLIIEDNVLLAGKVFITDHFHGNTLNSTDMEQIANLRELYHKGDVIIKNNVWIGENVSIMPGVNIGSNSIIGANSVVTKSIPQNCIAAGNPAKVIRQIGSFDDEI